MSGFLKDNRCFRCGSLHAECSCIDELQSQLSASRKEVEALSKALEIAEKALKSCETDHSSYYAESSYDEELVISALSSIAKLREKK